MTALDLKKYEKMEAAKLRRERFIAEHADALASVDAKIAREMMALGIAPIRSAEGKVKKAGVSAAKKAYWDNLRSVATSKGTFIRRAGSRDCPTLSGYDAR
jgi:hypothetical protein